MSYILDGTIIPRPKTFVREFVPVSQDCLSMSGKTGRDVRILQKEKFTLSWENLSKTEVESLLTILAKNTAVTFSVNELNLTISQVDVIVDMDGVEYSIPGSSYLGNLKIVLKQVEQT